MPHSIAEGTGGTIYAGKYIDTRPPCGMPANSCKLILSTLTAEIYLLEESILTAITSPGTLLSIVKLLANYAILQLAQLVMAVVSTKVILKLEELPKYLGLPNPLNFNNMNPVGLVIVSICKLKISKDWTCIGAEF